MSNQSIKPIIEKLESLFSEFNTHFYEGQLEVPVITVAPDVTSGAYGWCTSWKAWTSTNSKNADEPKGYYEINICAEHLSRPFNNVAETLLHEMVHLWNLQQKIKDTSRSGKYHNKNFKIEAENHGLIVERDSSYGFCRTSLQDESQKYIESLGVKDFTLRRNQTNNLASKPAQSTRRYVCPFCGTIIRATKSVRVLCVDCDVEFTEEPT